MWQQDPQYLIYRQQASATQWAEKLPELKSRRSSSGLHNRNHFLTGKSGKLVIERGRSTRRIGNPLQCTKTTYQSMAEDVVSISRQQCPSVRR
jgi:predicted RNA-binding Zn-ribbon protein involved in translation (DUF1610 family)